MPEPELTLVVNSRGEIVGFCAGNDVSSRDIEGENPLYLPQAKVYDGSCALGPGIALGDVGALQDLPVQLTVLRGGRVAFQGETSTSQIKRSLEELVGYLRRELDFPQGVFLMTGTGIVPPNDFSLQRGDLVRIAIGALTLENEVDRQSARVPQPVERGRSMEPILIAGEWRQAEAPVGVFSAVDPTTRTPLAETYPVSGPQDVTRAFAAAEEAVVALRGVSPETIARFLEDYAARIEARADALVERAARETGLPVTPRLRSVELPRTTSQMRQGAAAARDRSWCRATIDSKANIRSLYAAARRPGRRLRTEQLPVRVQLRRRGRLRRRDRRGQSRDRQGEHRPPRDQPAARRVRARGGSRLRPAPGHGAARSTARRPRSASRWSPIPPSAPRGSPAARAPGSG